MFSIFPTWLPLLCHEFQKNETKAPHVLLLAGAELSARRTVHMASQEYMDSSKGFCFKNENSSGISKCLKVCTFSNNERTYSAMDEKNVFSLCFSLFMPLSYDPATDKRIFERNFQSHDWIFFNTDLIQGTWMGQ